MGEPERTEITWHDHQVTRQQREALNGHRGCVVWFTGLSGCGKSTVANVVDQLLHERGVHTYLLDGDNVRHALNASPAMLGDFGPEFAQRFGLGFSPADRQENIRRVGAVAELFAAAGIVTLAAFVSPYRADRDLVRRQVESSGPGAFVEVFVDTPLEVCEQRDPKGLYAKARRGELTQFTGIDAPYEAPEQPELHLRGGERPPEQLAREVIEFLAGAGHLGAK
ncbi:MAG: adenylyl-sulfate kinase [Planctomycetales bacterium]|nr:adenylyl-sulfate kinase [Planctomycetales bacterium]